MLYSTGDLVVVIKTLYMSTLKPMLINIQRFYYTYETFAVSE